MRKNVRFSTEFKKEKVRLYEEGKMTALEISKAYGISYQGFYKWIDKYGSLPKTEQMVVQKVSEEKRTLDLMKKVADLEKIIGQMQVQILYKECVIKRGSDLLGEDLEKKFD